MFGSTGAPKGWKHAQSMGAAGETTTSRSRLIAPAKDRVNRWMPPIVGTAYVMRSKILTEAANFGYQAIEAEKYSA
jgi:hypothetical protein